MTAGLIIYIYWTYQIILLRVICLSEGTAPSVIEQLANVTGRATEQTVLTCKINRGKPEADIKWCVWV